MIVHNYYPIGEPRVEREADALASNGYVVDVLCLRHPSEPATEMRDGGNIYRLPVRRHKESGVIVQFFEYLAFVLLAFIRLACSATHYDVVHVHNLPDFLVFSALIPRLRGARIVLDIHDLMPEFYLSRFGHGHGRWLAWLLRLQEKLACHFAHQVITVSEPWRQTLVKRSVPAHRCSVVMNVPGTRFVQNASRVKKISSGSSSFHLFYHGTLAYRYGIDLALRAVAQVRRELPDMRFTIHGRGEYLDSLLRLARTLELDDIVTFSTEYIPTEELPRLIASAHVGVVAYRRDVFTDGILPTKLMEYAELGIPAIVARTPAITAYFDETMVEFFTADDVKGLAHCIQTLYHDRSRLGELSRNVQRFNHRYNWATQKAEYISLVERLIQQ
jgi:glycosyltransferase involved in cell wall biosynthesis